MGWWPTNRDGKELFIGDQPLDTLDLALRKIIKMYKKDLERKPTPEELAEMLESSIRTLEEDLFNDMDERELESLAIKLKQRPKRPKLKPGDYFAIPLPSGGYGYGRIMKITHKVLLWMRLIDLRSEDVLSMDSISNGKLLLDLETRTQKITSAEWPIIGNVPLSDQEHRVLLNEPRWTMNYAVSGVEEIADWKLRRKRGLPPNQGAPYVGYKA